MPRPVSEHPTELELQILKILWRKAPQLVREVRSALAAEGRRIAHTSVITTLNTMVDKGYLNRTKEGNALAFSPRVSQQSVSENVLSDVVERVFDGSAAAVMLGVLDIADVDPQELKELRKIITQKLRKPRQ
jgi:BlaI family transcriptional regulator, penicillinase repressor